MTGVTPGGIGSVPFAPEPVPDEVPPPPRAGAASWRLLVGGGALCLVGLLLDGGPGLTVGIVVVAVILAGLPRALLGLLGVVALAGVPIAVLWRGLPSGDEISPAFVTGSLVPHHLTFAGLVLVGAWVVLDLAPSLKATDVVPVDPREDGLVPLPRWSARARIALFAVVAVVSAVALVVVWVT